MTGEDGRLAADARTAAVRMTTSLSGGESACNIEPPSSGASGWKPIHIGEAKMVMWRGGIEVKIESLTPIGFD